MNLVWMVPTSVLLVGAIVSARMAVGLRSSAVVVEVELAEASEALDVIGEFGSGLDQTAVRLEHLIAAVGGPIRLARQARRTTRHWWWRARRSSTEPAVPSGP